VCVSGFETGAPGFGRSWVRPRPRRATTKGVDIKSSGRNSGNFRLLASKSRREITWRKQGDQGHLSLKEAQVGRIRGGECTLARSAYACTACACQAAIGPSRSGWIPRKPVDFQLCCSYSGRVSLFRKVVQSERDRSGDGGKTHGNAPEMLAGWLNHLPRARWRAPNAPLQDPPVGWTNDFTVLDAAVGGLRGVPARGQDDEVSRRQHPVGMREPGGGSRLLFGAGEGPAEAVAGAKQESEDRRPSRTCKSGRVGQKWVSRHVLATCH
jgi:hypothetical protein